MSQNDATIQASVNDLQIKPARDQQRSPPYPLRFKGERLISFRDQLLTVGEFIAVIIMLKIQW